MPTLKAIIKYYENDFFRFLRNDYFLPAFQKMALNYSVSTSHFYDTVHDYEYVSADDEDGIPPSTGTQKAEHDYSRPEGVYNSYHRLKAIITRLSIVDDPPSDISGAHNFFVAKVFDANLQNTMLSAYNAAAPALGVPQINHIAPANLLQRCIPDSEHDLLKKASVLADYYLPNLGYAIPLTSTDRSAFTFVECATLSCIYLAFYRRSIPTLNRPLETESQRKRARGRLQKAVEVVYSQNFYVSLCKTALDVITDYYLPKEIDILQEYLSDFDSINTEEPEHTEKKKHLKKPHKAAMISVAEALYLSHQIFPVTELILMGIIPPDLPTIFDEKSFSDLHAPALPLFQEQYTIEPAFNFWDNLMSTDILDETKKNHFRDSHTYEVSEITYWIAREIAAIIATYITEVQCSTIELLRCLPEFKDFDEKLIVKYSKGKYQAKAETD